MFVWWWGRELGIGGAQCVVRYLLLFHAKLEPESESAGWLVSWLGEGAMSLAWRHLAPDVSDLEHRS